jgi:hypothetical protein
VLLSQLSAFRIALKFKLAYSGRLAASLSPYITSARIAATSFNPWGNETSSCFIFHLNLSVSGFNASKMPLSLFVVKCQGSTLWISES